MAKKKVTIKISEELHATLKKLAVDKNVKISDLYEEILNEGLRIVGEFRYGKMVEVIESKGVNRDISQKFTFDKKGILKQETDKKSTKRSIMKTDGNFKKHHHHHKKNDSSKHHKDKSKEHKKHKDKEKEKDRDNKSHRSKNK